VDLFRTQVWFAVVALISGKSAYALDLEFHPESVSRGPSGIRRPRLWDRYKNGRIVVGDALVARVETVYPGSADWFHAPLWQAFKPLSRTQDAINAELLLLGEPVAELMFKPGTPMGCRERKPFNEEAAQALAALGTLEALAAAILLVQEAEAIASEPLRSLALGVYRRLMIAIKDYPPLQEIYPILFDWLDDAFPEWVYPQMNLRMRVLVLWQGYRDASWPEAEARQSRELCKRLAARRKTPPAQLAWQEHFENLRAMSAETVPPEEE
jgi:hypothetical protein